MLIHLTQHLSIQPRTSCPRCSKSPVSPTLTTPVIIPSHSKTVNHSPQPPPSPSLPLLEDLNFSGTALRFPLNSPPTANIHPQESQLFTTDSSSTWLPSSSSSLPAQHTPQHLSAQDQDFVLFETPSARSTPSLSHQHALTGQQNRRHSAHLASTLQNQRVAAIIQATGHSISTSNLTNRLSPSVQNQHQHQQQFYASSAPNSSVSLNQNQNQQRQTRPPVPLFSQSTGNIPQTPNMAMQGIYYSRPASANFRDSQSQPDMDLFDEFTAFEGGASTQAHNFNSAYSSPAVPTIYDPTMNLSSSSSTNMGTVSPQDLLVRDSFASAPNSTAFTNLTSPSTYNESPDYNESFEVSPFVGGNQDLDHSLAGDPWYPLFPQDEQESQQKVPESPLLPEEELQVAEHLRSNSAGRRRSGTGSSPIGTHAAIAGINARKRDKPLPPIVVDDPNDTVAMKRARNTLAARKSRQRKMQKMEELEDQIAKLEAERDHWKNIALRRGGQTG